MKEKTKSPSRQSRRPPLALDRTTCDGCKFLVLEPPVRSDARWLACCTDPDKPLHGARRVIDATIWKPFRIVTPVWCENRTDCHAVVRDGSQ